MLEMLLPRRCVLCRTAGTALCPSCATSLPPAPDLGPPPGFAACGSLLRYQGPTKELVAALKFRGHCDAVSLLGQAMADLVEVGVDLVTWAPTSPRRRRQRGFDQAELLAREVGSALRVPVRRTLVREGSTSQTGRNRSERLDGPGFRAIRRLSEPVLVVDDVRTTGATLSAAGDALIAAGATRVAGVTLAVTP